MRRDRQRSRGAILAALLVATFLGALDSAIVSTAIPSVVRDLGGFSEFPWVFSIYLLTQAVTVPIYGRLADSHGRKPVLVFGISLFLAGSVLSGLSWNMLSLILFRGIQGIGAGAVIPIAMTIVGDLYTIEQRGRIQGILSGVWGVAAIIGPGLGGAISQFASWRWIFYLNLPVGAAAIALIVRHLKEEIAPQRHRLDVTGALTLMAGTTLLLLALLEGGAAWRWTSPMEIAVLLAAVALLASAVVVERRAAEPFLPPWVFSRRVLLAGNVAGLCMSALLFGLDSYAPTLSQGVIGVDPVLAGFALGTESLTWILGSTIAGRLYPRFGFRFTGRIGAAICCLGALLFVLIPRTASLWSVALGCGIVGLGFGSAGSSTIVAIQSSVGWDRRGVVTGAAMFCRSIGGAIGVGVFGSIANSSLSGWLRHPPAAISPFLPHTTSAAARILGGSSAIKNPAAFAFVRTGLYLALHHVFIAFIVAAAGLFLAVQALPAGAASDRDAIAEAEMEGTVEAQST